MGRGGQQDAVQQSRKEKVGAAAPGDGLRRCWAGGTQTKRERVTGEARPPLGAEPGVLGAEPGVLGGESGPWGCSQQGGAGSLTGWTRKREKAPSLRAFWLTHSLVFTRLRLFPVSLCRRAKWSL